MKPFRFVIAICALTLPACGGDDASTDAADAPAVTTGVDESADTADEPAETASAPDDGPVSTLSPEIAEQYLEGIGPVDVEGSSLAALDPEAAADPALGEVAPTLVGLDLDGDPIRIDPATDGPAMIVFVAHWCPHCNDEIPRLNQLRDDGRFPDGLDIVAVATASRPDRPNWPPGEWLTGPMDWTYPAMLDGIDLEQQQPIYIAASAYGVSGFPFTVLVNGDGTVAERWSGERDPDEIIGAINHSLSLT